MKDNFYSTWRCMFTFILHHSLLPPQKNRDWCPLDMKLFGAQSHSANDGQEREMPVLLLNKPVACKFTDSYFSSFL